MWISRRDSATCPTTQARRGAIPPEGAAAGESVGCKAVTLLMTIGATAARNLHRTVAATRGFGDRDLSRTEDMAESSLNSA